MSAARAISFDIEPHNGTPETACYEDAAGSWGGQVAVIRASMAHFFTTALFGRSAGKSATGLPLCMIEGARLPGAVYQFNHASPFLNGATDCYRLWREILSPLLVGDRGIRNGHDDVHRILHIR